MRTNSIDRTTTAKDMKNEFIAKIKQYQDEIDEFWQKNLIDKRSIMYVNERLHRLFKRISSKLEEKEVKRQSHFQKRISEVKEGMFFTKTIRDGSGSLVATSLIDQKKYAKYQFLIEKRELELNGYLEQLGLTIKEQTSRLR
tara:strand:+ start:275 stop:700 length:426 start_codon:yes stop_codon:yes gene_type:complete